MKNYLKSQIRNAMKSGLPNKDNIVGRLIVSAGSFALAVGTIYAVSAYYERRERKAEAWLLDNIPDYRGNGEYDESFFDNASCEPDCWCQSDTENLSRGIPNYDDIDEYYGAVDPSEEDGLAWPEDEEPSDEAMLRTSERFSYRAEDLGLNPINPA